jgi:hypothetical protein
VIAIIAGNNQMIKPAVLDFLLNENPIMNAKAVARAI